jgi:hypothetical protein
MLDARTSTARSRARSTTLAPSSKPTSPPSSGCIAERRAFRRTGQQHISCAIKAAHTCFLDETGDRPGEPLTDFVSSYTALRQLKPFLDQLPEGTTRYCLGEYWAIDNPSGPIELFRVLTNDIEGGWAQASKAWLTPSMSTTTS